MYYGKHQVETICEDDFDFFCTHPDIPSPFSFMPFIFCELLII